MRTKAATLAVAGILALSLWGCGDSDDDVPSEPAPPSRGTLFQQTDVATITRAEIDSASTASGLSALSGPARCDVRVQQLSYQTVGARGETDTTATAALLIPTGTGCEAALPLVAYNRGTSLVKATSMANATDSETASLIAMYAAQGYAVVAPDYLGYAGSNYPFHPYLHADSEASATIDAIRAARQGLQSNPVPLNGRLLLAGYSQGGHASMATQRAIETDLGAEFALVAAGHMSGPYNLPAEVEATLTLLPTGTLGAPAFMAFALTSYQKVYGDLYADPGAVFKQPYATGIDSLLPGTAAAEELVATGKLPVLLGDLITDALIAQLRTPGSVVRGHLERNSLIAWTPKTATLLCGGRRDPVVGFANTTYAQASFASRGAMVTVVDVEQVAQFADQFPPQLSTAQLLNYHGGLVPPLCFKVVRDQLFNIARG